MQAVSKNEFIQIANEILKTLPDYCDAIEIINVRMEKHVPVLDIVPSKGYEILWSKLSSELIQIIDGKYKIID